MRKERRMGSRRGIEVAYCRITEKELMKTKYWVESVSAGRPMTEKERYIFLIARFIQKGGREYERAFESAFGIENYKKRFIEASEHWASKGKQDPSSEFAFPGGYRKEREAMKEMGTQFSILSSSGRE